MLFYNNYMRYTTQLHAYPGKYPNKRHALQLRWLSTTIGFLILGLVGAFVIVASSHTDVSLNLILQGFGVSLVRITISYIAAVVLAVILAIVITASPKIEALLLPIFDVLQSFPSFALFPILITALASAPELVIIIVLVVTIIWPILFTIIGSIKNRRIDLEEAASVYGATGLKRFQHFTVPSLWPSVVTGSIVGWGEGWEFIIGAELLVRANQGIGSYLGKLGAAQLNGALAIGIIVLMMLLFIINKILWLPLLRNATHYQSDN